MGKPLAWGSAVLCALALAACSANLPPLGGRQPERVVLDWPDTGRENRAARGEVMFRQGSESRQPGIVFDQSHSIDGLVISEGFYPQIGADEKYTYHAFQTAPSHDGFGHIPPTRDLLGGWIEAPQAIRVARDRQETCAIFREMLGVPCSRQMSYRRLTKSWLGAADLQRELTYLGRTGDVIHLRFAERSGHFARPERSETLDLRIGADREITVLGARIRVHAADPDAISYTVIAPFTDYWSGRKP